MLAIMNQWAIFLDKLMRDFRESTYSMEKIRGVKNFSSKLSSLRSGRTETVNQSTIKDIEKALNIIIDDSNPEQITYTRLDDHSRNIGQIKQTGDKSYAGNFDNNRFDITENSSAELIAYLKERIEKLEFELIECRKKLKIK